MDWQSLWANIQPHLIVWANGFLVVTYWVVDNAALLISLACGLTILLTYDRAVQHTAGDRLMRYGRGTRVQASYRSQTESLVTLLIWTVASAVSAQPVPFIGMVLWLAFLVALKLIPQEREGLLFRQKTMIAVYGLLAIALRLALSYSPDVERMTAMLNNRSDAALLFDSVRDGLLPYIALVMWVMYPLGYLGLIAQRFAVNRGSLLLPRGTPEDVLRSLRTRGER
jgi:amino acid transporter